MSGTFTMSFSDVEDMVSEIVEASPEMEREFSRGLYARPITWAQLVATLASNVADMQERAERSAVELRLYANWLTYNTAEGVNLTIIVKAAAYELWKVEITHPKAERIEIASRMRGQFIAHGWVETEFAPRHAMADDASMAEFECESAMGALTMANWKAREGRERWERVAAAGKALGEFEQTLEARRTPDDYPTFSCIPCDMHETITSEYSDEIPVRVGMALAMVREDGSVNMLDRPRVYRLLRQMGLRDVRDWLIAYRDLYLSALNVSIQF